jgi:hypothetical protein
MVKPPFYCLIHQSLIQETPSPIYIPDQQSLNTPICLSIQQNTNILSQFQNVQFCPRSRKAKILTTGIPGVFRGLKFETDAEIGQKGAF